MEKHYNIKIYGKVQGVAFRYYTKEKALELDLKGLVRNEADNSVYLEVEGEEEKLYKFLEWLKTGPDLAEVKDIKIKKGDIKKYNNFVIALS